MQACEVRTVAADSYWLSPSFDTDSLAVHFTWTADTAAVRAVLPEVEAALSPRPHWAKLSEIPPATLAERYPAWSRFADLLSAYDPEGKFRNAALTHYFPLG
ncbi:D-arabinono-1,4-lactone oxidase [Lentzea tibetensis]|uniref:D-arabinono-1,4-lactone oxidase n=1 Tax=Lentzea tibetensis TaxID=2591470 RepID=UPI001C994791|nr:D-arabinono-1,4-lactone oxidase [Lentzea tibetensis]